MVPPLQDSQAVRAGKLRRLLGVDPRDVAHLVDGDRDLLPVRAVHRDVQGVRVAEEARRKHGRRTVVLPSAGAVARGAGACLRALLVDADMRVARREAPRVRAGRRSSR